MVLPAALATGGCAFSRQWRSPSPAFTVRYPASWHVSDATGPSGPVKVFSPQARPGPLDAQICLLRTMAQPPRSSGKTGKPLNISMSTALSAGEGGLPGHRWLVTMYPAAVVIEAYAPPERLDEVRRIGQQMADDIVKAGKEKP
jgi:hypothetical protein